jgi:hypothetical protein
MADMVTVTGQLYRLFTRAESAIRAAEGWESNHSP